MLSNLQSVDCSIRGLFTVGVATQYFGPSLNSAISRLVSYRSVGVPPKTFPESSGLISHIHLEKSPQKEFRKSFLGASTWTAPG